MNRFILNASAAALVVLLLFSRSTFSLASEAELAARLEPLLRAHKGKVAVAVKHLESGEAFAHQADVPMPTASLIKFPIMVEAYRRAEAKEIDLGKVLTL